MNIQGIEQFSKNSQNTVLTVFKEENPYVDTLLKDRLEVKNLSLGLKEHLHYGVENVCDMRDDRLASFFYVLSEVENINSTTRDFLIDAMIFSENEPEDRKITSNWNNTKEMQDFYKTQVLPKII